MITKTVYSLIYPETKEMISTLWNQQPHQLYERAWLKYQDSFDKELFTLWKQWVSSVVYVDKTFEYTYPSGGSSEAIRAAISTYASKQNRGKIHQFKGEYEGYAAYAQSMNVEIIEHDRFGNWKESINKSIQDNDIFFISQPSSINGNVWVGYNDFATYLDENFPKVKLMLDLCYVGVTTHNNYQIKITPNVAMVFFSLSKAFGVYYHRIGGVLSREPIPSLYGNKWFKNLFSIQLGINLLKEYSLGELPKKYSYLQEKYLPENTLASDVLLLAHSVSTQKNDFSRLESKNGFHNRFCLTPFIQMDFGGEVNG
jgi:histidinol-phosphate/aromatic aminotransferase/cobyric acid decarboxylase-like protein